MPIYERVAAKPMRPNRNTLLHSHLVEIHPQAPIEFDPIEKIDGKARGSKNMIATIALIVHVPIPVQIVGVFGRTIVWASPIPGSLAAIGAFVALEVTVVDIRVDPLPHALEGILVSVARLRAPYRACMSVVGRGVQIEPTVQPAVRIDINRILQQLAVGYDARSMGIGVGNTNLIVRVGLGYRDIILERDPRFKELGVVMLRVHPRGRFQVVLRIEGIKCVPR